MCFTHDNDHSYIREFRNTTIITFIVALIVSLFMFFLVDKYKAEESKVNVTVDIVKLVTDIKPNVTCKIQDRIGREGVYFHLNFDIENKGVFAVNIDELTSLSLSLPKTSNMVTDLTRLKEGKDYKVVQDRIGYIMPGSKIVHQIGVIFENDPGRGKVFYELTLKTKTDECISKNLAVDVLGKYFKKDEISKLSKFSYTFKGLLI